MPFPIQGAVHGSHVYFIHQSAGGNWLNDDDEWDPDWGWGNLRLDLESDGHGVTDNWHKDSMSASYTCNYTYSYCDYDYSIASPFVGSLSKAISSRAKSSNAFAFPRAVASAKTSGDTFDDSRSRMVPTTSSHRIEPRLMEQECVLVLPEISYDRSRTRNRSHGISSCLLESGMICGVVP